MTQSALFSGGIELASYATSSVLLRKSWHVIKSCYADINTTEGNGISWKVFSEPGLDLTILAFDVKQDSSDLQEDLVPSDALQEKIFPHSQFLFTKRVPHFSVNKTVTSLLCDNYEKLNQLKSKINSSPRLIVTGHDLGGQIASLFTLSLLDNIDDEKNSSEDKKEDDKKNSSKEKGDDKKKHPLCITFGSPLVGDKQLQEAISRSSTWSSCFLHVVSCKDPLPRKLNPLTSAYMPFGKFLFCSDTNSTCFENPESDFVLELLGHSIHDQSQASQSVDYGGILENLYRKAIFQNFPAGAEDYLTQYSNNSLHASICLQLLALGLTSHVQQVETLEGKIILPKREIFNPSKTLNKVKIEMARLEWYKMDSKSRDIGYYDCYKKKQLFYDDAHVCHKKLTSYWEKMFEGVEMKPPKEVEPLRVRWLYAGTNYRRMVEPLAIAKYYRKGDKDNYLKKERSEHFVWLEKELLKEETTKATGNSNDTNKKNVDIILTFDSCFWAHVEEALLLCKQLENVQSSVTEKEEATRKLLEFEDYVFGLLKKYEVSTEIFLEHSSYMTWWNQYKAIKNKETSYTSALADFMSNQYKAIKNKGTYNFPTEAQ